MRRLNKEVASVSVIIPCFKCSETIERAVKSIAEQTVSVAELILIDDKSDDTTLSKLYTLKSTYPDGWIKVIALDENQGPATARNAGWKVSVQPYIAFLDADDAWHKQKIEFQYSWMRLHPEVALTGHTQTYCQTQICNNGLLEPTEPVEIKAGTLLLANAFSTRGVMLKSSIAQRFNDGQYYCEDYLLWLQVCLTQQTCYRFNIPLAYVFKKSYGEQGLASNLWKMEKGELQSYQMLSEQGLISFWQRCFYSSTSLLKFVRRVLLVSLRLNQ